jgi:hypothetical protein
VSISPAAVCILIALPLLAAFRSTGRRQDMEKVPERAVRVLTYGVSMPGMARCQGGPMK